MENKYLGRRPRPCLNLGEFDENWTGWELQDGRIYNPVAWALFGFTPGDVLAIPVLRQQIDALEAELRLRPARRVLPSPRLTQLEALQGAIAQLEAEIRTKGTDDELAVLRLTRGLPATPRIVSEPADLLKIKP